jgi:Ca-activated chloride channel homolog
MQRSADCKLPFENFHTCFQQLNCIFLHLKTRDPPILSLLAIHSAYFYLYASANVSGADLNTVTMKQLLLIAFCLSAVIAPAQTGSIELGTLTAHATRYADIAIPNKGEQTFYLVKIEHSPEIVYRVSGRYTRPDSTLTVRVQVNPDKTGLFDHVLRIYLSDQQEPYEWRITGMVDEVPDYTDVLQQKCPEFVIDGRKNETEFTVFTIDAQTKEVLRGSKLTIVSNGKIAESWQTGSMGSLRRRMEPGFAHFVASFPGYYTQETGVFISPEVENIYIPLVRIKHEKDTLTEDLIVTAEPEEIPESEREQTLDEQFERTKPEREPEEELSFDQIPFEDSAYFRPVNIVFVLDLSESMKRGDKLNMMKFSLQQLIRELRPQDNISLVVYSETAKVLVPMTSGEEKYLLRNSVADLEPKGVSSSMKGLKLGYKQLEKQKKAVNMLVIITDGAFNNGSDAYQKLVKQNEDLASFNVVAIQPTKEDEIHLGKAADYGRGSYIRIQKLSDANQKLLDQVRKAAYVGK